MWTQGDQCGGRRGSPEREDDDLIDSGSSGGGEKGPELADGLDVRVAERVVGWGKEMGHR